MEEKNVWSRALHVREESNMLCADPAPRDPLEIPKRAPFQSPARMRNYFMGTSEISVNSKQANHRVTVSGNVWTLLGAIATTTSYHRVAEHPVHLPSANKRASFDVPV